MWYPILDSITLTCMKFESKQYTTSILVLPEVEQCGKKPV